MARAEAEHVAIKERRASAKRARARLRASDAEIERQRVDAAARAAVAALAELERQNAALRALVSPFRLGIKQMRELGYTPDEIDSIILGHKQSRYQFEAPGSYRALHSLIDDAWEQADPTAIVETGEMAYRYVAREDEISQREAYGWILGYPPEFGVVN